ncbi:unnamed protein product [Porites lobata]|uniref:Ig-like domain-containing protein n=1 Tax=Porites lobata TaxID=104759 RepID=A0ABN8P5S0_9CNID|nr:unnamed protein product [Porites lobata]
MTDFSNLLFALNDQLSSPFNKWSCTFPVSDAPGFTKHPDNIVKIEGETAIFNCTVDGNPEPSIDWTKDNVTLNITADPDLSQSNSGKVHSLEIRNVYRSDKGQYRCVANNNSIGSATSLAGTLSVHYKPEFSVHPQNATKIEEDNVTFTCNATGNPAPTFRWTKIGSVLTTGSRISLSSDGKHLTITNVTREDSGQYVCEANNNVTTVPSDSATLNVQYAPGFTKHPDNILKIEGETAIFNCTVDGNPEPSIDWTKDNVTLNITADPHLSQSNSGKVHSLEIRNVNRSDKGQYRCVANNNSIGSATSLAGTLSVHYQPEFSVHPQNATKIEGDNVTFTCNATGNPAPTFRWTKHGSVLTTDSRISLLSHGKHLTITNVTREDSGQYVCEATNNVTTVPSDSATLNVQYAPGFTKHPDNILKIEGETAIFNCTVDGNPEPSIDWTKDNVTLNITADPHLSQSNSGKVHSLEIRNVNRSDKGQYRCVANNNSIGSATSLAGTLSVHYQPEFSVHPQNATKIEGDNVTFTCNATGNPAPTFRWTKNGSVLTTDSRISLLSDGKHLTITNVTREDSGQYVCEATNNVTTVPSDSATLNVQYAPGFTKHPDNILKIEGETAIFNCTVDGNPEPSIDWTKDNVTLNITADPHLSQSNSGKVHSLEIRNVNRSDKGQYRCVAKNNSIGSATSLAGTLSVHYQPEFSVHPQNATKIEGDNVTFTCNATGNPAPTFRWTKNGSVLTTDSRISLLSDGKHLTITNVTREDSGQYVCEATNNVTTVPSDSATLNVQYAPGFTKHPDNIVKIEGETAIFNCTVDGNPEPSIDWTKDNVTLNITADPHLSQSNSGKVHALEIRNVYRSDRGQYRCVANNNSIGSATSLAGTLSVHYAPGFTKHPDNILKIEGETAIFNCTVDGNPEPSIDWTKDNVTLNITADPHLSQSNSGKVHSLEIRNVYRSDKGQYRCVANNNSIGFATSLPGTLSVHYQPEFSVHPQNATKIEGDNVTFTCNATGNPAPTFRWTKNGSVLTPVSRISLSSDGKQLTVTNVTREDSGQYFCEATNNVTTVASDSATLNVKYQPEFSVHPQNATKIEGDNVTFTCNATGNPAPTFRWTKNGSVLTTDSRISLLSDGKHLTIRNVTREDSGQYVCEATNNVTTVPSDSATLNVQYAPGFTKHPDNILKIEGETAIFNCTVDGNPEPSIDWTKDNVTLNITADPHLSQSNSGKVHSLEIRNVNRSDKGQYRCVANNNSIGSATSLAGTLSVHYQPEFSVHPQNATKIEGDNVTFTCNATGNPAPTFRWTKNGSVLTTDSRISLLSDGKHLTITNVTREDSGQYVCEATNNVTTVPSDSATLNVQYAPGFTKHPDNILKIEGETAIFNCTVDGNPEPSIDWTKDNVTLNITADPHLSQSNSGKVHSLEIRNVNRSDKGQYRCVANNNSIGSATSLAGTLSVHYQPEFSVHPQNATKIEGITLLSLVMQLEILHLHSDGPKTVLF